MNFDFHNSLFPEEFENFCRDILDVRENPIRFTTYRRGKDGGIDIKATNTDKIIIGQCKLYNPNNYSKLKTVLKKEVTKCKKQNPNRYILCINCSLSVPDAKEILDLFQGYIIEEEDIIDGKKLNKYLELPEYRHLLKTYSKLLAPNLHLIELALENAINNVAYRKYFNKTRSFLSGIVREHKLYHNTKILEHCVNKLEKNNVLIITGNPGIGKTTTAKMIANYFFHQKTQNILFLEDRDFLEIEGLIDDNQLIIVDDFWGQNHSPSLKENSMLRSFNRIINDYKNNSNRYLLLTSRDYIIKDVLNSSEFETREILDEERFTINLRNYSQDDKVRIFLNHLLYYDFEKAYFTYLMYDDILENIIHHENYSPRHIEYFIKQYLKSGTSNKYHFFKGFYNYLNNPQEYWNDNFQKLNGTSQLILLIILISSDPIDIINLERTFEETQEASCRVLNKNIQPTEFYDNIKLLEDFYIVSDKVEYSNQILVRFQSPGIKDYLLEYLRTEGKYWIKPLIENVPYFNQLHFVFSTKEEEIDDYDSDICFYGKKIILSESLQSVLKNRLLTEFHQLNFCTPESRDFTDLFTRYETSDETKYWKLILLNHLFNISKEANNDVRRFIIREVQKDEEKYYSEGDKIVDTHSMNYFPSIIELIKPFVELDNRKVLSSFYSSISFTKEFDTFYRFREIFPFEFDEFIKKNIVTIRKRIRYCILDDIDYYLWNDMHIEFDTHLDFDIDNVCKKYGARISKKFAREIEDMAERPFRTFQKAKKRKNKKAAIKSKKALYSEKFNPKKFDKIVEDYLPDDSDDFNVHNYLNLKKVNENKELLKSIKKDLKNGESVLKGFTENQVIFSALIDFLLKQQMNVASYNFYTISDTFFNQYSASVNINSNKLKNFFFDLAKNSFQHDYSITSAQIKNLVKEKELSVEDNSIFSPIIIPDKNWYKFSSYDLKIYFIVEHLKSINANELFRDEVIDYSYYIYEPKLLEALDLACQDRLHHVIVTPELERFISQIDATSEKSTVLSFIKFFEVEIELEWNRRRKTFESFSTNGESFIEMIFQHLGIDFSSSIFGLFFDKQYYFGENIGKYCMEINGYINLYNRIVETQTPESKTHLEKASEYFNIKLFKFANNEENYKTLRNVGLESFVINIFKEINHINKKQMCFGGYLV